MYIPTSILENGFIVLVKSVFALICTGAILALLSLAFLLVKSAMNLKSDNRFGGRIWAIVCAISIVIGIVSGLSLLVIPAKSGFVPMPIVVLLASLVLLSVSVAFIDIYDFELD